MRPTFVGSMVALLIFVAAPSAQARAIVYTEGLQSQQCIPNCSAFGSLIGTITTDGTIGVGLAPTIVAGWNLVLNDGTNVANLTSENSFITSNFTDLLSATPTELSFNFSAQPNQGLLEFTSSINGSLLAEIFSATGLVEKAAAVASAFPAYRSMASVIA